MKARLRFTLSAVDFATGVVFLLFSTLVLAFGHEDVIRTARGSGTSGDVASVRLLVGFGASGLALLWAGVAVVGDRCRRALIAQAVSTPPAVIGMGLVVWALAAVLGSRDRDIVLLITALAVVSAEWVAAMVISGLALRSARRRVGDGLLASQLAKEGPTVEILEGMAARGITLAPFRVALVGYRIEAVALSLLHVFIMLLPALVVEGGRIAWSRGEMDMWLWLFVVVLMPYLVLIIMYGGQQVFRYLCILRRAARFPEGLGYAHNTTREPGGAWVHVPPPYADAPADRFQAWSERLRRAAEPLLTIALLLGPVLFVGGIMLMASGRR